MCVADNVLASPLAEVSEEDLCSDHCLDNAFVYALAGVDNQMTMVYYLCQDFPVFKLCQ